jgi:hypothetical protein
LITTLRSGVLYSGIYYLLTSGALANADIPFLPDFRGQR